MMQPESPNKDGFELDLSSEFIEPMLKESLDRFVLFPIEHGEIWESRYHRGPVLPTQAERVPIEI